eukprot:357412-Chlamydomonas_euryale.AAC.5
MRSLRKVSREVRFRKRSQGHGPDRRAPRAAGSRGRIEVPSEASSRCTAKLGPPRHTPARKPLLRPEA